jgi:NADPH-dependent 2,4-dienoyl-CoA reductase/sulfur reductase-like enzyme
MAKPSISDGPVVVGGGPSGLAAAIELRRLGISPVTVIEREREAGGIPRHSDHTGFGLRDLRSVLSGPRYASRYRDLAEGAGVEVLTETMVTEWEGDHLLKLTGPNGRWEIEPPAIVLATGCRERPRSARLVPGSRPAGVMTTATLQQLVHLRGRKVGRRAVIVGAEHVSFSAVATLAHGGASVAGLVTELPHHQSLRTFRAGAAVRYRVPVWTRTKVSAIHGAERVESVELTELDSGRSRTVDCDVVVFTADWIPDHELAVMAGCELDPGTRGPLVDPALRTARRGVFAAGNLLHPAETADVCALDGRHVAPAVAAFLRGSGEWPSHVRVTSRSPLAWVAPNLLLATEHPPPRERFLLRSREFVSRARLHVRQDGRELWSGRVGRLVPGRSAHIPAGWATAVDPVGGPVIVAVK